jgi:hypothetical protein
MSLLFRSRRSSPLVVPILVGALLVAGCTSIEVQTQKGNGPSGSFEIAVFADADAEQARKPLPTGALVELFRIEKGKEIFLQRSLAGRWGIQGLPEGSYRLRLVAVLDEEGNIRDPRGGDRETEFKLREGESASARILLKKTPVGLIVVAAITVVVLAVVLIALAKDGDLDIPTPPSPEELLRHLPPPPHIDHVVFWTELGGWDGPDDGLQPGTRRPAVDRPPRVTSAFPEHRALVAARRVSPSVTLSQPISSEKLGPDTIRMLGSKSGLVSGKTVLRRGLLRFEPDRDLVPGEEVTVTILADGVENGAGTEMEKDFSWWFRVAPAR